MFINERNHRTVQHRDIDMQMICWVLVIVLIILWLVGAFDKAQAQQSQTFYGPDGRMVERCTTDSGGQTTCYGQDGRMTRRIAPDGTVYGQDGRSLGHITPPLRRRP